jgi:hypothetical protein
MQVKMLLHSWYYEICNVKISFTESCVFLRQKSWNLEVSGLTSDCIFENLYRDDNCLSAYHHISLDPSEQAVDSVRSTKLGSAVSVLTPDTEPFCTRYQVQ